MFNLYRFTIPTSRRVRSVTNKVLGPALYYGAMIHVGIYQTKAVLCRLCRMYLRQVRGGDFWLVFGLLVLVFTLLNCLLTRLACRLCQPAGGADSKSDLVYFGRKSIAKYTRSGAVYGYM